MTCVPVLAKDAGPAVVLPQSSPMAEPCFASGVAPEIRVLNVRRFGRAQSRVVLWLPARDGRSALLVIDHGTIIDAAPLAPLTAKPGDQAVVAFVRVPLPGFYDIIVKTVVDASAGTGCSRFFEAHVGAVRFPAH